VRRKAFLLLGESFMGEKPGVGEVTEFH
jgi:hypothetical protein